MNQMTFRTDRISIILLLFLICFEFKIYAQYSLPPKINYFLSEKEDFRKNEELRSDEYKREGQFNKALNEEQFFRDKAKDLKLTYKEKDYDSRNFAILIDTLFIDFISHQYKNRNKTDLDSLITIVENNKGMQEIFEKINTLQNFYGNYYFMDATLFHRYGPGGYSFQDTTFDLLEPGNYGFDTTDSTFIQPRLNEISDINVIIAAYIITGNKLWQKTDNSWFFDDYIEKTFSYVDSNFRGKDISKKIDAYILIGDMCMKYDEAFYPPEYITHNPLALKAYLKAYNLASLIDFDEKIGFAEFKISNFYNPNWHNDILDKSIKHLENAIENYKKGNSSDSYLSSLMLAKRINLECMKLFREGYKINDTEMIELIELIIKFKDSNLNEGSDEINYYYYQALGYYFSSTKLKSDLEKAKAYFQAALFYAFQNYEKNDQIVQQIKVSINYLFWIYGNLNLEFEAINLYDLVFEYAEAKHDVEYQNELLYLESYMWYNLGNSEEAQESLTFADTLMNYNYLVYNPKVEEIKSHLAKWAQFENFGKGVFTSDSKKNLEIIFKFFNYIEGQVFRELSNLNTLEYEYQIQLLEETKLKVEKKKRELIIWNIIAALIIFLLIYLGYRKSKKLRIINKTIQEKEAEYKKIDEKNKELENEKFESDKKAALSQVLARCMSHNIGSHALSKFMDKDVILSEDKPEQYFDKYSSLSHQSNDNDNKDRFKGESKRKELIANFNEYLKYRMDFLADIATTAQPFMETPMYFASNLFKGFDKNRILLNRISGVSSDITFQFKLIINGMEIKSLESDGSDRMISIPNDVLGAQAFYIILENIIRNIYKHGNPAKEVEIAIHLDEFGNDKWVYQVSVFDNIFNSKSEIDSLVKSRNKAFDEFVLQSEENDRLINKLRSTNLGTVEMAVCAAYLKGLPVTSIEDAENKLNFGSKIIPDDNYHPKDPQNKIIYAYSHFHDEEKYALGYRFYLHKPKQALIVTEATFSLESKEDLDSIGIKVVNPKELATNTHFHQQFICFDNAEDIKLINDSNRALLPKRVVFLNESVNTKTANEFFASIWRQHVTGLGEGYSGAYFVYSSEKREISWTNQQCIFKAYIDNHHNNWKLYYDSRSQETADEDNQFIDEAGNNLKEFEYYEMGCSHSTIKKYISKKLFGKKESILPFAYLESVFLRIIILDERIQKAIMFEPKKMYADTVPFDEHFKLQHIFIPRKDETDLNAKDFGDYKYEDSEYARLIKYINQRINDVHFCIIHLGLIERMCPPG